MSGLMAGVPTTALSSAAIPLIHPSTTAPLPQTTAPPTTGDSSSPDPLTAAILGLQRQMGQFATRLSALEGWASSSASGPSASGPHPASSPYGMPGYGGIPAAPTTGSVVIHTAASAEPQVPSAPLPINQIPFPHSPSPLPTFSSPPPPPPSHYDGHSEGRGAPGHYEGHADARGVPRFQKLSIPTFDGMVDPLAWMNKCEHFFRAQRTPEVDKVWLASFHMNGVAQHWYYMLERDAGGVSNISWPLFKALCHQRFGPPLATNHLSDLARLPFRGTVAEYQEAFQARMAHAGPLSPLQ